MIAYKGQVLGENLDEGTKSPKPMATVKLQHEEPKTTAKTMLEELQTCSALTR